MSTFNAKNAEQFKVWLRAQGAEVLAPTNPYEVVRFRAKGAVRIVYRRDKGESSIKDGVTLEAVNAFQSGSRWNPGLTKRQRTNQQRTKAALLDRDGDLCWFCGKALGEDITVEHLVAHAKGGPDHQDNLVLAHQSCNQRADNLPLVEKIKLHVAARLAA